jgi:hypothetical protein
MSNLKISLVIEAVDKATAVVERINQTVNRATAPVRQMNISVGSELSELVGRDVMTKRLEAVRNAVGSVKVGFKGLGAGSGLPSFVHQMSDLGSQALTTAQRSGTTVEMVQKLGFAASQNHSSAAEMSEGLKDLNRNAGAAANGSEEAARWFRLAGVNIRDAQGHIKSTDQLVLDFADSFSKMDDSFKKSEIATGAFGRSGEGLIPTLNLGRKGITAVGLEAERLGIIMDKETAQGFDSLGRSMENIHRAGQGVFITILKPFLPIVNDITAGIVSWVSANRELIAAGLGPILAAVAGFRAGQAILAIGALTVATVQYGLALMATPVGWFLAACAAIGAIAFLIIKNWTPIQAFFSELWAGIVDIFFKAVDVVVDIIRFLINTVFFPFIAMLRIINALLPDSARRSPIGGGLQKSLDFLDGAKSPSGKDSSAQEPVKSPIGAATVAQTNVGGKIRIEIDALGQPRVTQLETDNPDVDLSVYSGQGFAAAL